MACLPLFKGENPSLQPYREQVGSLQPAANLAGGSRMESRQFRELPWVNLSYRQERALSPVLAK